MKSTKNLYLIHTIIYGKKRYKSKGIMTRDVGTQTDEVTFQCGNCNAITKLK